MSNERDATAFTPILRDVVERTPGVRAAVFAAGDGEEVEHYGELADNDVRVIAAHYGILLDGTRAALTRVGAGPPATLVFAHDRFAVVIRPVGEGYYLLLVAESGLVARAARAVEAAAEALRVEMG